MDKNKFQQVEEDNMPTHKSIHILQPLKPTHKPKLQKEYAFHQPEKNCIKKIPFPSKNFKNAYPQPYDRQKNNITITDEMKRHTYLTDKNRQLLTGVCCQWRDSASYDSEVHFETFVLRGKFSDKIATEQQPPKR